MGEGCRVGVEGVCVGGGVEAGEELGCQVGGRDWCAGGGGAGVAAAAAG